MFNLNLHFVYVSVSRAAGWRRQCLCDLVQKVCVVQRELVHTRVSTLFWLSFIPVATPTTSDFSELVRVCVHCELFHKSGPSSSSLHSWVPDGHVTGNPLGPEWRWLSKCLHRKSGDGLHLLPLIAVNV